MKAPYIKIQEDNETRVIYKKLMCHSFIFGEDIDDKNQKKLYFIYLIKDNQKIALSSVPCWLDKEISIREHWQSIKKEYEDAYLDTEAFSVILGDTKNTTDIYFEAY